MISTNVCVIAGLVLFFIGGGAGLALGRALFDSPAPAGPVFIGRPDGTTSVMFGDRRIGTMTCDFCDNNSEEIADAD